MAERDLATAIFLALRLERPLLLEGEPGVGKTEVAKAIAASGRRELIRLQCYDGLDVAQAVYDWDYARQMLHIRLREASGTATGGLEQELYGPAFLRRRALLRAIEGEGPVAPVLLIDEIDRADEEFEAFLLELLSDWQITIPEIGTIRATQPPVAIITSNRTREVHDALKRRCLYHWIPVPLVRQGAAHRRRTGARRARGAGAPHRDLRAGTAGDRSPQSAGHRRDARLGRGDCRARRDRGHRGSGRHDARHARQVAGGSRHRPGEDARAHRRGTMNALLKRVVGFGRELRESGLGVTSLQLARFVHALPHVGIDSPEGVRTAARTTLATSRDESAIVDEVFDRIWLQRTLPRRSPLLPSQPLLIAEVAIARRPRCRSTRDGA